jgi:CRP/FNR family cyclic AMP-dependent transcriptional regulator
MSKKDAPMWASFIWQGSRSRKRRSMLNFLRSVPLFSSLSKRELLTLNSIAHLRTYQEDEFVFRKGQPGAAMFIIKSGEINIVDHDPDSGENVIATLDENSFFGELALLDDSPRSASAKARVNSEVYAFFRTDLERLLTSSPQIGLQVYRALAMIIGNRLKSTNEQLFNK